MNKQEIFDFTARHLLQQGEPAIGIGNQCRYRAKSKKDGRILKCAIGCHIPDDKYTPRMDADDWGIGTGFSQIKSRFGDFLPDYLINDENFQLLKGLQAVHDVCAEFFGGDLEYFVEQVRGGLKKTAQDFNLSYAVLDEDIQR